ncbi:hypothetical protein MA16_Dca028899 [Dendrobium catenatum]|uniref:Uncharacterized protein n=1 Tax=Dendrobium catenatum TaxID=906689 RepID=A0A2I0VFN1_9ASPA|nr:hypothetical protein MA16_Dca028899 [Dendrobium catenatum]
MFPALTTSASFLSLRRLLPTSSPTLTASSPSLTASSLFLTASSLVRLSILTGSPNPIREYTNTNRLRRIYIYTEEKISRRCLILPRGVTL